jgi:hypothetical protein
LAGTYNKPINSLTGSLGQKLVGSPSYLGHYSQQVLAHYWGVMCLDEFI